MMSYAPSEDAKYFTGYFDRRINLMTKTGEFPSGLLPHLIKYLNNHSIHYNEQDCRLRPSYFYPTMRATLPFKPYADQVEALAACSRSNGIIRMPTGTGKSITMAMVVDKFKLKTLIVVPSLELKIQLKDTFTKIFGSLNNVTIENIDSKELQKPSTYDLLIIDEAHHAAAKTYQQLNKKMWNNIYHRFFFTATPFRTQEEENLPLESLIGTVIYTLTYKKAVANGYIVPIEAYYIELPKTKCYSTTWREVYDELVVNNKERNALIATLLDNLYNQKSSTLCLVKEIAHGDKIAKNTSYPVPFVNGLDEESRRYINKFNSGSVKVIIGTTGILGEGVDSRPAEYILITGLGKSRGAFMQQCGRGFRTYPGKTSCKIILFYDPSHKFTRAHFKEQVKTLESEYGVTPLKL